MNEKEFYLKQQAAVEHMRQMNLRAQNKPAETFKKPPTSHSPNQQNTKSNDTLNNSKVNIKNSETNNSGFNLSFIESIFSDGDTTIIIGLLLLLMSEKADKLLLFALVYILL